MKKTHFLFVVLFFSGLITAQVLKTVDITAGGLNSSLTASEKTSVTELIITGTMNSNDFYTIRSGMPVLEKLNLSGVTITNNTLPSSAFEGKQSLKEVLLPENLRVFDNYSFYNCNNLTSVNFPDSLRSINYYSFYQCYELSSPVILPEKLTNIGSNAFNQAKKINQLVLSDSLREIASSAFISCSSLSGQLVIPSKVTTIGSNAFDGTDYSTARMMTLIPPSISTGGSFSFGNISIFYVLPEVKTAFRNDTKWNPYIIIGGEEALKITVNVNNPGTLGELVLQQTEYLKDVNILEVTGQLNSADMLLLKDNFPDLISLNLKHTNITAIPDYQFRYRYYIRNIVLPDSLENIGQSAFYRCNDLQEIVIPEKVKSVNDYTFYDCYQLKKVSFPPTLEAIKYHAFANAHMLSDLILPDSLNQLGEYAFYYNYELDSLIIPQKVTAIQYAAFHDCRKLKYVKFPDKLTLIRNYAFQNCPIDTLIFPTTLQTIEGYAFQLNTSLKHIVCQQPTPPVLGTDPFNNVQKTTCTLEVPFWSMNMYKQAPIWTNFATVIPFNKELKEIPVSGPLALLNNVRPSGFPNITILTNGSLSVGGNTPFPIDRFVMEGKYNSTVFGNLINDCPAMSANSVTVKLDFNSNKWYFLSFPFDVKVADIRPSNTALFAVRKYDGSVRASNGTGGSWKTMTADSILRAGQGFIINLNATSTVTFPAIQESRNSLFTSGDKSTIIKDYPSEVLANKSWNFVGNVFPSYYDSRYLDYTAPITVWNLSNNTYTAVSLIDDKYALKPFEGFFIQKPDDLSQLAFIKEGRQLTSTLSATGPARVRNTGTSDRSVINLYLSNGAVADKTRVVLNPQAQLQYEIECDASKFFSDDPSVPQLYSFDNYGNTYAINERPVAEGSIPIGIFIGTSGTYTLRTEKDAVGYLSNLILEDKLVNNFTDLLVEDYTFSSEAGTTTDRFILRINNILTSTANEPTAFSISGGKGKITIRAAEGMHFNIYTTGGTLAGSITTGSTASELHLPAGIYLVKGTHPTVKIVVF